MITECHRDYHQSTVTQLSPSAKVLIEINEVRKYAIRFTAVAFPRLSLIIRLHARLNGVYFTALVSFQAEYK